MVRGGGDIRVSGKVTHGMMRVDSSVSSEVAQGMMWGVYQVIWGGHTGHENGCVSQCQVGHPGMMRGVYQGIRGDSLMKHDEG